MSTRIASIKPWKRLALGLTLGTCLVAGAALVPATAQAATAGDFTITGGKNKTDYTYKNGLLTIKKSTKLTIKNTKSGATGQRINVDKNVSANITLAGVDIDRTKTGSKSKDGQAALNIAKGSGKVKITLAKGTANFLRGGFREAGLQKDGDKGTLTIDGEGKLIAYSNYAGAGIGSGYKETASGITIAGGDITSTGGNKGAGIGGGEKGAAKNITISGGDLKTTGFNGGAGIGGGREAAGTGITVTGGTVSTKGNTTVDEIGEGAGIGGGYKGKGADIKIRGGKVTATGGFRAAGIGGGCEGNGENITVSGGTVEPSSSARAAGIGCGYKATASNITISGGTVNAMGNGGGTGIGAAEYATAKSIKITGGTVTARAADNTVGSGIGAGRNGKVESITIDGGVVDATANFGAAIGSGWNGSCANVTINGGVVTAATAYNFDPIGPNASKIVVNGGSLKVSGKTSDFKPVNASGKRVYLFKVDNPSNSAVVIDGKGWNARTHAGDDKTLYAYLTGEHHEIAVGDEDETCYHFVDGAFAECTFGDKYSHNSKEHWLPCEEKTCTERHESAPHIYTQKVVDDKYAVPGKADTYYYSCVCGAKGRMTFTTSDLDIPRLKIGDDNYWYVSYDKGKTWTSLGVKATGPKGDPGPQGPAGPAGKDGKDAGSSAKDAEEQSGGTQNPDGIETTTKS